MASELENEPGAAGGSGGGGGRGLASRVVREELGTGAVLLALENRATPTVSLRGSLRAGSYFEPRDKPGLARVTAEMLKRGTRRRSKLELAGRLESVGADVEFEADVFAVQVSARSLSQDFPLLVELLAEMLREPSFPADELEKLKQQTVAAVREQQSDTRWRARERLIESVGSITVGDVRGFYEKFYGGRSLILSVVGDVRPAEAAALLRGALGDFGGPEGNEVSVEDPAPQEGLRREV